jgi:Zn finger protein HypA/HybF involved in hydrogenase expression
VDQKNQPNAGQYRPEPEEPGKPKQTSLTDTMKTAVDFSADAIAQFLRAFDASKNKTSGAGQLIDAAIRREIQCGHCGHKFAIGHAMMKKQYEPTINGECLAFFCQKCGKQRFWVA